jgi:hypothetical protein
MVLGYAGRVVPRWTALMLIAALAAGVSGVLPAVAAAGDCCGDSCADEELAGHDDGCDDTEQGGDGMGCPPLCTSCVCAAYFAPALPPAVLDVQIVAARADVAVDVIVCPESAPATGVFHPPRAA